MSTSVYDLLTAAARGRIGVDQRFVRSIVERGEDAVPDLLRFGLEDHDEDPVALELDVVNMLRVLRTPRALDYYVHLIELQPHDIEDEIVEAFIEIGEPSVEPLLQLYEKLGEEEGGEVAFLLASLRIKHERIRKLLVERLDYDAWDGAICLGLYGDPDTRADIERVLNDVADTDENRSLRRDLQRAIEDLESSVTDFTPQSAEQIISEYPEQAGPDFDVLSVRDRLELLSDADAEIRAGAAESFINAELTESLTKRLFDVARNDSDAEVRGAAWRALSGETEDPKIEKAMLARLADTNTPAAERKGALIGMAFRLSDPDVRQYVEELYANPETRAAALEAMRRSLNPTFASYFPPHLEDEDPDVRREAIWGVGYLGITDSADRLQRFFEDEELRPDALFAYSLAVRGETSRGRVKGLLRKIDQAANGLSEPEEDLVKAALDERLALRGLDPVFAQEHDHEHEEVPPAPGVAVKIGRNDPCPCGSGKKYKKCCGA